jgi:hypothetical protein
LITVVASAARRARYWETVTPPRSTSPRKVFMVIGVATLPALIRLDAISKMRRWRSSMKWAGSRKSETR